MAAPARSSSTELVERLSQRGGGRLPFRALTLARMTEALRSKAAFEHGAILGVEVSTNGPQGGDAGHGGWVEIVLTNLTMMDMGDESGHQDRLVIKAGGDFEMTLLGSGLAWAGQELLRIAHVEKVEPEPWPS